MEYVEKKDQYLVEDECKRLAEQINRVEKVERTAYYYRVREED